MRIKRTNGLKGRVSIPGDKSISHRSIMLGSIADGTTEVHNFLQGADCLSSIACFRLILKIREISSASTAGVFTA